MESHREKADLRSELVRLAARLIVEEAWRAEAADALGQEYYVRGAAPGAGYRNSFEPSTRSDLLIALNALIPEHLSMVPHTVYLKTTRVRYDYWRWIVYELRRLVEDSGLKVEAAKKLTTGPPCAVFW
jgi:hypothetical protein